MLLFLAWIFLGSNTKQAPFQGWRDLGSGLKFPLIRRIILHYLLSCLLK